MQGLQPVIEVALYLDSFMMVNPSEQFRFRSADSEGKQPLAAPKMQFSLQGQTYAG
jgi:hypothetical protein